MQPSPASAQLEEANKYIFVKAYHKASEIIERLILQHGQFTSDVLLHLRRIELALKTKKLPEILHKYEEETQRDPSSFVSKVAFYFAQHTHGDIDNREFSQQLQELLKDHGPHAASFYGLGLCMELEGNLDRAKYNYQQCINLDASWYPAYFGLSQIYYQAHDDRKGDQYFFLFEELAPYNVYGNFETHRRLSLEFLERGDFPLAEVAVQTLSEWWFDNKGHTPLEIQLYEQLATSKITEIRGDYVLANQRRSNARLIANRLLDDESLSEGVLYFSAKVLEEFSDFPMAIEFYRRILHAEIVNPELVQKIGNQLLNLGEEQLALQLFTEAYQEHPDQDEIRFCLLVAKLKIERINIEEYLAIKEKVKKLMDGSEETLEVMGLLHSLLNQFVEDPDVHSQLGESYLRLGNKEKARKHFSKMYELDSLNRITRLKYAAFMMQFGDLDVAKSLLDKVSIDKMINDEEQSELYWLQANFEYRTKDFSAAIHRVRKLISRDPWNVAYLILQIRCLNQIALEKQGEELLDSTFSKIADGDEQQLNWSEYDRRTKRASELKQIELAYARDKIRFLYGSQEKQVLSQLIDSAQTFNPQQAIFDFLKLINTNFDSPEIYWTLGCLFKELWQLETASMWFDQMLLQPHLNDAQRSKAYVEQADCYIWRGIFLDKAIEYAHLALDINSPKDRRPLKVLAHGLLKIGKVRQAEACLEESSESSDPEIIYLRGLLQYRNGAYEQANIVWKPLLTLRTESLRFHNIKQEIMRYYFDREPYRGIN